MNPEFELVKSYAEKVVLKGLPVSRETLAESYYEQISSSVDNEPESVSEKWIDYFWNKMTVLTKESLVRGLASEHALTKLAYTVLGK